MESRKNDESSNTWFRSDRLFEKSGQWFIRTREGLDVGPFADKPTAAAEAGALQAVLEGLARPQDTEATIKGFLLDAQMPTEDLSNLTDYVVKEGSF